MNFKSGGARGPNGAPEFHEFRPILKDSSIHSRLEYLFYSTSDRVRASRRFVIFTFRFLKQRRPSRYYNVLFAFRRVARLPWHSSANIHAHIRHFHSPLFPLLFFVFSSSLFFFLFFFFSITVPIIGYILRSLNLNPRSINFSYSITDFSYSFFHIHRPPILHRDRLTHSEKLATTICTVFRAFLDF